MADQLRNHLLSTLRAKTVSGVCRCFCAIALANAGQSSLAQPAPVPSPGISAAAVAQQSTTAPAEQVAKRTDAGGGNIRITVDIPRAPDGMQLFKLRSTAAPVEFLDEKLKAAGLSALKPGKQGYIVQTAVAGSPDKTREGALLTRAFVDRESGETEFIPSIAELIKTARRTPKLAADEILKRAAVTFRDPRFIPKDATEWRLAELIPVMGGAGSRPGAGGGATRVEPLLVMTMAPVIRYAAGLKVYGRGSHAVASFASDGTLAGAVRRWRTAAEAGRVKTLVGPDQVRNEILRQLRAVANEKTTTAVVDLVELAYYDNDRDFLQPVYHFEATVSPRDSRLSPVRVSGFVPVSQPVEPIPDLAAPPIGDRPNMPKGPDPRLSRGGIGWPPTPDDITLGEYANIDWRNDSGYVSMSNTFYGALTSRTWTPPVTRTQWYEAHSWEVVGPASRYYLNAVNVAYTVPHGDWLINSADRNCCDIWDVRNIGTGSNPGYGWAAGKGVLASWIIMSCEVLPSFYDRQVQAGGSGNGYDAFNPWWPVFRGLHNVIAFRTIMFYPDNDLQWAFGRTAALGGDLNAAWFQSVAAQEAGVGTYASGHLAGSRQVHYDRASSMVDGRNLGQSIFAVYPQSASSTLWNFWMGD